MEIDDAPVAVITGAGAGIGAAFARRWYEAGNRVVLLDRNLQAAQSLASELGSKARAVGADVTDDAQLHSAFESIAAAEGRIDTLLTSAGVARPAASEAADPADFMALLDLHVAGALRCAQRAYDLLRRSPQGTVVNVGSVATFMGMPQRAAYTAAKAGIGGLTRTLAVEWAPAGIRVNAVAPGYVATELTDQLVLAGKLDPQGIIKRTPLRRFAQPEEIAEVIWFLATAQSRFVTGQVVIADGGLTIDGDWY
ncbi:SDR family NAD(P)-dependent oxidoreductase [Glutamicibacter sp.]|uniref:SDR family NAD(P)-dependent oxidoreductase n=1 Tax=Glutamicibacter sp. TaxID=1931995 RepID=UPI003D6BB5E7